MCIFLQFLEGRWPDELVPSIGVADVELVNLFLIWTVATGADNTRACLINTDFGWSYAFLYCFTVSYWRGIIRPFFFVRQFESEFPLQNGVSLQSVTWSLSAITTTIHRHIFLRYTITCWITFFQFQWFMLVFSVAEPEGLLHIEFWRLFFFLFLSDFVIFHPCEFVKLHRGHLHASWKRWAAGHSRCSLKSDFSLVLRNTS